MVARLTRANFAIGLWPVRLAALAVLLGVNHGPWRWIVGGILLASLLLEIPAWWYERRRNRDER